MLVVVSSADNTFELKEKVTLASGEVCLYPHPDGNFQHTIIAPKCFHHIRLLTTLTDVWTIILYRKVTPWPCTFIRTEVGKFFEPVSPLFFLLITLLSGEKKRLVLCSLILFHGLNRKPEHLLLTLKHRQKLSLFQMAVLSSEI